MAASSGIRPLVAGNWKMNGLATSLAEAGGCGSGWVRPGLRPAWMP